MDVQTVREHADAYCAALLAGDIGRASEEFSQQLKSNIGEVVAAAAAAADRGCRRIRRGRRLRLRRDPAPHRRDRRHPHRDPLEGPRRPPDPGRSEPRHRTNGRRADRGRRRGRSRGLIAVALRSRPGHNRKRWTRTGSSSTVNAIDLDRGQAGRARRSGAAVPALKRYLAVASVRWSSSATTSSRRRTDAALPRLTAARPRASARCASRRPILIG